MAMSFHRMSGWFLRGLALALDFRFAEGEAADFSEFFLFGFEMVWLAEISFVSSLFIRDFVWFFLGILNFILISVSGTNHRQGYFSVVFGDGEFWGLRAPALPAPKASHARVPWRALWEGGAAKEGRCAGGGFPPDKG